MRVIKISQLFKISLVILTVLVAFGTFDRRAEAASSSGSSSHHYSGGSHHNSGGSHHYSGGSHHYSGGYRHYYGGYHYYPGYFRSFYPYWYGFGFGYGWPYYYGYGYSPYYYRPYYYGPYSSYGYYGYGEIRIEVKPKTAKVYVDGAYTGTVDDYDGWWQRLRLEPGTHRVVIRGPGFTPYAETVRVLPGEDYHIKVQMQPGEDRIAEKDMLPERSEGNDRGYDRRYDNRDDRYRTRPYSNRDEDRDRDRYQEQEDQGRDQDRDRYNDEDRNKQTFILQVDPHDATVYIDGNYYGTADVNENGEVQVLLPRGVHKVEVVRPGYESFSQDITIDGKDDNRLMVQLHKK
jgi:hypothetical protein